MNIIQDFIPKTTPYNRRPGIISPKNCIVVHNNANLKSTARNERSWLINVNNIPKPRPDGKPGTGASWNLTVDDIETIEAIPINEVSWSAGDGGQGRGNLHGISIEICEKGGLKAEKRAIELIAYLMVVYAIPLSEVLPHKFFSGKICPRIILPRWNKFIADIQIEYLRLTTREVIKVEEPKGVTVDLVARPTVEKDWEIAAYNSLINRGIEITERRFEDKITRGEVMALVDKALKYLGK